MGPPANGQEYPKTLRGKKLRKLEEEYEARMIRKQRAQVKAGKVQMLQIIQGLGRHTKDSKLYPQRRSY